VEIIVFN
jgi:hypothetical protein